MSFQHDFQSGDTEVKKNSFLFKQHRHRFLSKGCSKDRNIESPLHLIPSLKDTTSQARLLPKTGFSKFVCRDWVSLGSSYCEVYLSLEGLQNLFSSLHLPTECLEAQLPSKPPFQICSKMANIFKGRERERERNSHTKTAA